MAIQAITGLNPAKANYNVSFNGKSNNPNPEMPNGGSGLGYALPLAILMATSPMNPVSAAEQYNRYVAVQQPTELVYTPQEESLPEDTYMLVPSTQEPEKQQKKDKVVCSSGDIILRDKGSISIRLTGYSTDDNDSTFEKMFLLYKNFEKNPSYRLNAKLFAFCPTPREDGRYVVLMGIPGDTKISIAAIPKGFGEGIFKKALVNNPNYNNHAVKILSMEELLAKRGAEYVNNSIPPIEEFVPTPEQQKCTATGD